MKSNQFLIASLLCFTLLTFTIGAATAQTGYSIEVQNYTWDHYTLRILLVSQEGEAWWDPKFINITTKAVGVWNDAFSDFASKYPNLDYVSNLRLLPSVSSNPSPGFDVYVYWVEGTVTEDSDHVGLTRTYPDRRGVFTMSNITLSTRNRFTALSDLDLQNIAQHEIGHALGLLHSNHTQDIMYAKMGNSFNIRSISTLDVYAVVNIFGWMSVSLQFNPANQEMLPSSISLPTEINYEYLEISEENLPPPSFFDPIADPIRNILSAFFDYVIVPTNFVLFLLIMFALILAMIMYRILRPKKVPEKDSSNELGEMKAAQPRLNHELNCRNLT